MKTEKTGMMTKNEADYFDLRVEAGVVVIGVV